MPVFNLGFHTTPSLWRNAGLLKRVRCGAHLQCCRLADHPHQDSRLTPKPFLFCVYLGPSEACALCAYHHHQRRAVLWHSRLGYIFLAYLRPCHMEAEPTAFPWGSHNMFIASSQPQGLPTAFWWREPDVWDVTGSLEGHLCFYSIP